MKTYEPMITSFETVIENGIPKLYAISRDGDRISATIQQFADEGYHTNEWHKKGNYPFNFCFALVSEDEFGNQSVVQVNTRKDDITHKTVRLVSVKRDRFYSLTRLVFTDSEGNDHVNMFAHTDFLKNAGIDVTGWDEAGFERQLNMIALSENEAIVAILDANPIATGISGERFYPEAYMNPEITGSHWQDDPVTLWWFGKEDGNE